MSTFCSRFDLRRWFALPAALGAGFATWLGAAAAEAREGTHPVVVSTWDARASSVLLEYRRGLLDGGGFNQVSYHANFSSTTGKLSAQFGLHYLSFDDGSDAPTAHGLSATAASLFSLPVASRFDNGLARAAVAFYVGSAPTALVSGERNYLSIPFVLGFGVPISPAKVITLTPWFEFSPGVNLDTIVHPIDLDVDPAQLIDPVTGEVTLTEDDVEAVLSDAVELDTSVAIGARAGLDFALHVSDAVDLGLNATLSSIGPAFKGTRVIYLGGGLIWRWDDIVPAVLPPGKRLLHESCDAIEERFRSCPNAQRWRSPEQLAPAVERTPLPPVEPPAASPLAPPSGPEAPAPAATFPPDAAPPAPAPDAPASPPAEPAPPLPPAPPAP